MYLKQVALIVIVLGIATARAAISFGPAGTGTITFDTLSMTNGWSTRTISGSASSVFTEAALDAAVQTNTSGSFVTLVIDSSPTPGPSPQSGWSSSRLTLFTRPAGVLAQMLMATLRNDSSSTLFSVQIVYDFEAVPADLFTLPEIPGYRVYFSLTGHAGSWEFVPALSGDATTGSRHAVLNLLGWAPGVPLYLLWVQDNAAHSPDHGYLIDNFFAGPEPPPPPCLATHPTNVTAAEGQPVTLSATSCSNPPFYYQWYRNGEPIEAATGSSYAIPRVHPADAGSYFVLLSNSTDVVRSATATVTVIPDGEPPRALIACQVDDTNSLLDSLVVFFSERMETNGTAAATNYFLRSGSPGAVPAVVEASILSETSVVLRVESLLPDVSYTLEIRNVTDRSHARHFLSPHPTTLTVQTFGPPTIAADHPWKYMEAPTNTTWPGWMNSDFDDSIWPTGPGAFGLPLDEIIPQPFVIRTLIRTPDIGGPITTYFRTPFNLTPAMTNAVVQLSGIFDEGAIVYLNGTEVWRVRLPNGPVTSSTLATNATEPHVLAGPIDIYAAGTLRPGANWLAVELHQMSAFSGDAVMGLILRLSESMGCVPVLSISRAGNNTISLNWSCGGTLQSSPTPSGPLESWRDIPTQTNSFTTNLTTGALFYRVRL